MSDQNLDYPPPPPHHRVPEPPQEEVKKPWYLRWWGIAIIALFFIGFLMTVFEEDEEAEVADALEEVSEAAEETPAEEVPPAVEEPEPETAPEPAEPSHDWPSTDAYIDDLSDSVDGITGLLDLVGETANMYGTVPDEEIAELFDMAAFVISTHIDHFEGTTPPPQFAESQRLMLESWRMFHDSWEMAARAVLLEDPALLNQSIALMQEANLKIDEATAALP